MKIRLVNIIEISLGLVFCVSYFLTKLYLSELGWVAFISSIALGILYFPLGFYTLKFQNISTTSSIIYGVAFSTSIVAILFNLININFSILLLVLMIGIFLMIAGLRAFIVFLFTRGDFLEYNNAIAVRYLILFIYMIYIFFFDWPFTG
jgi:hypothetical protein